MSLDSIHFKHWEIKRKEINNLTEESCTDWGVIPRLPLGQCKSLAPLGGPVRPAHQHASVLLSRTSLAEEAQHHRSKNKITENT